MNISFHGHAVVQFEHNGSKVIIDPFINGNSLSDLSADEVKADYIILTHGHNDHVGDTVEIAKNNDATVLAPVELADFLEGHGVKAVGTNIGGTYEGEFGSVKWVHAFHSSSFTHEDGSNTYTGMPTGVILKIGDKTVYHTGDTGIFGDMELISRLNGPIDLLFIPIGDHFTIGIDDAAYAVNHFITPEIVVPIHYNTFPPIETNPQDFKAKVSCECQILSAGDSVKF